MGRRKEGKWKDGTEKEDRRRGEELVRRRGKNGGGREGKELRREQRMEDGKAGRE